MRILLVKADGKEFMIGDDIISKEELETNGFGVRYLDGVD